MIDSKCLEALKKVGLAESALSLAKACQEFNAHTASSTLKFLEDEGNADQAYVADITVTVREVP